MIRNYADKETARLAAGVRSRKLPAEIEDKAMRLLRLMQDIVDWNELRSPPGNKLHALSGNRAGQYAIWINDQWRIAFRPDGDGALNDVEVTDYH